MVLDSAVLKVLDSAVLKVLDSAVLKVLDSAVLKVLDSAVLILAPTWRHQDEEPSNDNPFLEKYWSRGVSLSSLVNTSSLGLSKIIHRGIKYPYSNTRILSQGRLQCNHHP
jgi:hypothetical protein